MTALEARIGLTAFGLLLAGLAVNLLVLQSAPQPPASRISPQKSLAEAGSHRFGETSAPAVHPEAARVPSTPASTRITDLESAETVRAIQRELRSRGYETGAVDGVASAMTRAAIMAFEHDNGAIPSGEASEEVLRFILLGSTLGEQGARSAGKGGRRPHAESVTRGVQQGLVTLGYNAGKVDGIVRAETVQAIREFERANAMPVTGRISGPLVGKLTSLIDQPRKATGR